MTRDEARGLLMRCEAENYCPHYLQKFNCDGCKQRIALDMAIEALKEVQKHEETFEWCHDCKEYDTENYCCHRWSKVIRNTVEELKDEPQFYTEDDYWNGMFTESAEAYKAWIGEEMGKTSDLIRKEDVIKAFDNKIMITGTDDAYKFGAYVQGVMDKINELPTVSADRPHGEWIERLAYNTDLDVDVQYIECDQCGHRPYFGGSYRPKYCEECGAKMDSNTDNPHGFTADEWYRNTFKGGDAE